MSLQQLRSQNKKLKEKRSAYLQQLEKLKIQGQNHQKQIDTLLQFNERLVNIIQNQSNNPNKRKSSSELQIIAETGEVSPQLGMELKNKLNTHKNHGFNEQEMQGFEEADQEQQQVFNRTKVKPQISLPQPSPPEQRNDAYQMPYQQKSAKLSSNTSKLDRVYEQIHHKQQQVSIDLTNSIGSKARQRIFSDKFSDKFEKSNESKNNPPLELDEILTMIKEYKEEFVDNSSEYQQICVIIRNDLQKDFTQISNIKKEFHEFCEKKNKELNKLKNDIKNGSAVNELKRIMKKQNLPMSTAALLQQRIINKYERKY